MKIKILNKGVTFPKGFSANGIHCGIRRNKEKKDLAFIYAEKPCVTAAVYTQNMVCGAPITVTKKNLENHIARAVICNSGNANTCNADGIEKAEKMCKLVADKLKISPLDVIVASTGVIGQSLPLEPIANALDALIDNATSTTESATKAAEAILTTDTKKKEFAVEIEIDGIPVKIAAISKGSGMIEPNMATMLCFITTDADISYLMLQKALNRAVSVSYNMISVDGDTSTNDMACIMASGLAGNTPITEDGKAYKIFETALTELCKYVAMRMAEDGEGSTKLLQINIMNAESEESAQKLAKSVVRSSLVKTAMFGSDANWGRILCALGYSGVKIDPFSIDVGFSSKAGEISVCKNGKGIDFSEELAKIILNCDNININIDMKLGTSNATAWGCDLSYEYVRINGDYRT